MLTYFIWMFLPLLGLSCGFTDDAAGGNDGDKGDGDKGDGDKDDGDKKKPPVKKEPDSYVTDEKYKSLMAARDRKLKEQFDKVLDGQNKAMELLEAKLLELTTKEEIIEDKGDKGKQKTPTRDYLDLQNLQRKHKETQTKLTELSDQNKELKLRERNFRFETVVKEALARNGCTRIEAAFRMIKPDLKLDEAGEKVYAIIETESGEVELDAEQYVQQEVKEKVLPEFFNGSLKPGSPAAGTYGSKDYDFTGEQVADPKFYAAHHDEIEKAMDSGRIKWTK